ncbi:ORF6N domain-containing protein [Flavobacterium noncentrifugens]|uniref:ORF6N domain-containing protein n=1 Tax=Flavobacterium noncentrifugens TaxID=1128970 RepID=A0A1G8T7N9_9FLAO|nr:ORF6N domain-containing protein [Flavobacterium noncentrifugens]SDJ37639.1 ORF6N domain-containing protein [Flavobacterium noncentrifugens]
MHNDHLQSRIHSIRYQKVMLDFDLATLYEIETKVLNQAVKRHIKRFPSDFMFRLSSEKWNVIRSQFVTASQNKRNINFMSFAFTEQGIAMLSGILNSDVAINVNIAIMRTFVMIRNLPCSTKILQTNYWNSKTNTTSSSTMFTKR